MCSTCMPSTTGVMHARTAGLAVDLHEAVGALAGQQRRPRWRWYLNERENTRTPSA